VTAGTNDGRQLAKARREYEEARRELDAAQRTYDEADNASGLALRGSSRVVGDDLVALTPAEVAKLCAEQADECEAGYVAAFGPPVD
jgi:hypothetical protein